MEHIKLEINKNRVTQLILLNLEEAFETIWHNALIVKLQKINTPCPFLKLIINYLQKGLFMSQ